MSEAYTIILVAELGPVERGTKEQLLIGVHPEAPGPATFSIIREPAIPGSFRFETDTTMSRLTLPREQRYLPAILAFRKEGELEEGYVALRRGALRPKRSPRPTQDDDRLGGLQLGGYGEPGNDFVGWIGTVLIYDRGLTESELLKVFTYLRKRYPLQL